MMMFHTRPLVSSAAVTASLALMASASLMAADPAERHGPKLQLNDHHLAATHITATVIDAGGAPVEGAVVVTSEGGQGVTDSDGIAHFAVELHHELDAAENAAHVTAVAVIEGVNHVGSVHVDLRDDTVGRHELDAGVIPLSADGECEPEWIPRFGSVHGTNNSPVQALTVFDDGSGDGPVLIVAGSFTVVDGIAVNAIAQWNGMYWSPLGKGVEHSVFALAVFDDGSGGGPALYVGGFLTMAGDVKVNHIARWDGSKWSAVGGGMDFAVTALTVFDDGSGGGPALYAGGTFTTAGDVEANNIAKWDGAEWSALGSGVSGGDSPNVNALTTFDDGSGGGPALYVGGTFTMAGEVGASNIARWDGAEWSPLADGVNARVHAFAEFDDGSGDGPALYVGGSFTSAGDLEANRIARWDGTSWSTLGEGLNNHGLALLVFDDGTGNGPALYVGGTFMTAGGIEARRIAKWDGANWSAVGAGWNSGSVVDLAAFDDGLGRVPVLFAGGHFLAFGPSTQNIAKWDVASELWLTPGEGIGQTSSRVDALAVFDDGSGEGPALYAGGGFTTAGGKPVSRVAKWDGMSWSPLGGGTSHIVHTFEVFDDGSGGGPALYAGGRFFSADGKTVRYIAKWDGKSWSALGTGLSGDFETAVHALAVFDDGSGNGPALYAGGNFTAADDAPAYYIAKWDGKSWSPVGGGMNWTVYALTVFDDGSGPALYAGGRFTEAGGAPANRVAKWDGSTWSPLGEGMPWPGTQQRVHTFAVFDDGLGGGPALYAGGNFFIPGNDDDKSIWRIARWNGTEWTEVGGSIDGVVLALSVFDDGTGSGPALYAAGAFTEAGSTPAENIAKWDGTKWSALGSGLENTFDVWTVAYAFEVFDDGSGVGPALYVGGNFTHAGGLPARRLAMWQGCPTAPECAPADLNCDGVVDDLDLIILLDEWGECPDPDDCPADLNGAGVVDGSDLLILLSHWG